MLFRSLTHSASPRHRASPCTSNAAAAPYRKLRRASAPGRSLLHRVHGGPVRRRRTYKATPSPPSISQPLPHSTLSRTPPEGRVLRSEAAAARSSSLRPAAPEVGDDTATPCCPLPCSSLDLTCLSITTALTRDVFPSVSCPGAPGGSRRSWSTAAEKKEIAADARIFPIKLHSPP